MFTQTATAAVFRPAMVAAQQASKSLLRKPSMAVCATAAPAATTAARPCGQPFSTCAQTDLVSLSSRCLNRRVSVKAAASMSMSTASMTPRRVSRGLSTNSRLFSTTTAASNPSNNAKRASPVTAGSPPALDWNAFFQLRKTRRRIQQVFSIAGGLTGALGGGLFLGSGVAEPLLAQVPLDPVISLGLMTFGFAALGWLLGPSLGNVVFYTWKRQYRAQMTLKETQFFSRIKKNRVDPSNSSASNPVPDFYGEKISSVAGYRQWLKDQRAFNKKRTTFV